MCGIQGGSRRRRRGESEMVRNRNIPTALAGGWPLRCRNQRLCTDLFCNTVLRLRGRRAGVVAPYGHARSASKRADDSRPYGSGILGGRPIRERRGSGRPGDVCERRRWRIQRAIRCRSRSRGTSVTDAGIPLAGAWQRSSGNPAQPREAGAPGRGRATKCAYVRCKAPNGAK